MPIIDTNGRLQGASVEVPIVRVIIIVTSEVVLHSVATLTLEVWLLLQGLLGVWRQGVHRRVISIASCLQELRGCLLESFLTCLAH